MLRIKPRNSHFKIIPLHQLVSLKLTNVYVCVQIFLIKSRCCSQKFSIQLQHRREGGRVWLQWQAAADVSGGVSQADRGTHRGGGVTQTKTAGLWSKTYYHHHQISQWKFILYNDFYKVEINTWFEVILLPMAPIVVQYL